MQTIDCKRQFVTIYKKYRKAGKPVTRLQEFIEICANQ